ncbi:MULTISPECIES: protease inhibitor I42 family protein [Pseudomonas]|uniref:protease inhibitor I42 family protein n=1 Tax=Pseudomonas TaxID=286 RepID=UPI000853FDDE|nr:MULTISPECIES: protease inhibitor I42 family protein [Pseudomonas]OEO23956.1 peptidase inhibitor I42 [Pseudomonas sp. J237]SFU03874.1 inhibitor of cysteine peptidase [Pseudomonas marincola]
MSAPNRLLMPVVLAMLAGCASQPSSINLQKSSQCPIELSSNQQLILTLPSNPTTGFRWVVQDAAPSVLKSLGPEVYSNPEEAGLVGSAGQSTWRFSVLQPGTGRLLLTYQRPWEADVAPEKTFDCEIQTR